MDSSQPSTVRETLLPKLWGNRTVQLLLAASGLALLWLGITPTVGVGGESQDPRQTPADTTLIRLSHTQAWSAAEGNHTNSIAWGDVDGDGDLDLAVGGESVRVYANEDGVLQNRAVWSSGDSDQTNSIAWGDVDGDGDLDLAVGNQFGPNRLYTNVGGTLQTQATWSSADSDQTNSIAWGDVDGDGDLDLAAGNRRGPTKVYINVRGKLRTSATWSSDDSYAIVSIAWGDVDGDGDLDLAAGNIEGANQLYINEGGVLQRRAAWSSDDNDGTFSIAWGDVDGDGDLDLAAGNGGPNKVYVNENGMLQTHAFWASDDNDSTTSIAWGDVDGDGDLDLAVGTRYGPPKVYANVGGALPATATWVSSNSYGTESIAWGDVDGDGDLDLALGNFEGPDKVIANEIGSLEPSAVWFSDDSDQTTSVAWGDVDGDGDLDLAVANDIGRVGQGQAKVYMNVGGVLQTSASWISANDDSAFSVAWGDVDGDGDLDLAVGSSTIRVYLNAGGLLERTASWTAVAGSGASSVAWGDVDGDGDLDLAAGGIQSPSQLYINQGGTLQVSPAWSSAETGSTSSVAWGDVDGDGDLDLAVGNLFGPDRLYVNVGGTLQVDAIWSSAESDDTNSIAWGDMDGDGDLDLAVGSSLGSTSGFTNKVYANEDGMLQASPVWFSDDSDQTTSIAWGDVDGDGDLDLAAGNWGASNKVYMNEGGVLQTTATWASDDSDYASSIAWGDVDGDGDLDLAAGNGISPNTLYLNVRPSHPIYAGQTASVVLALSSNSVKTFAKNSTVLAPANFYASPGIRASATIPIPYTTYFPGSQPFGGVRAFYSTNGGGSWRPAVGQNQVVVAANADAALTVMSPMLTQQLRLPIISTSQPPGYQQGKGVFTWDLFASGFFGQSDNVVVRIEALPYLGPVPNGIPGPFQQPFVATQTFPFRVRGTQVRVLDESGVPVSGAQVYHLPTGQTAGATPLAAANGSPFVTNRQGYLEGSGVLALGDGLVAMVPVTATQAFTLYHMSAVPSPNGLEFFTIDEPGVQELQIAQTNPLVLFTLDIALEWDARNDATFLSDLEAAIHGAARILFDITNGQASLGEVRIHQAKEHWVDAHVVLYAANSIHPRASIGGIVATPTDDQGTEGMLAGAYLPGQVRLGPLWDPFGESQVELGEDWQRAFAHELAHYLLFLPDNYLGLDKDLLTLVDCQGSFMTNAYDDDYSELLTRDRWDQQESCRQTVAQHLTGRADWETVTRFLPWLQPPSAWSKINPGPTTLPLAVPKITFVDPVADPNATLPAQNFDLRHDQTGELTMVRQAQAYLFKSAGTGDFDTAITDDQVIALGSTGRGSDHIKVRGAAVGDRLCVLAATEALVGCAVLTDTSRTVALQPVPDWQPDIVVSPVNSTTLAITVTQAISGVQLKVQVLPGYGSPESAESVAAPWAVMQQVAPNTFSQKIVMESPAFEGFVRVWVSGSDPHREAVTQFFLSAGWGPNARGSANNRNAWGPNARGSVNTRAWGANYRAMEAPIASGDGRVTIFNLENLLGDNGEVALQALSTLPSLPLWLTSVGQGYRFVATETFTRTIAFHYLQREVPEGYEQTLTLYYSPDEGQTWQQLVTELDMEENLASALMPQNGQGIYALLAAVEMPPLALGWNLFNYPIPQARQVATALASIDGAYTSIYRYDVGAQHPWRLYDATVLAEHPDLAPFVNALESLTLGPTYWLYATQVVTPMLAVPNPGLGAATASQDADVLGLPPATFYGPVGQMEGGQPQRDTTITARIGDAICGQSVVQEWQGKIVYKLQVASRKEVDGCGIEGAQVQLQVGSQSAGTVVWSNRQASFVALPASQVQAAAIPVAGTSTDPRHETVLLPLMLR